jgi:hypothetical protein
MFNLPLLKACVQQQQILEDMVNPPRIVLDRDSLADAVQLYAAYADLLDRTQRRLLFKAGKVNHPETPAIGSLLTALIQGALARGYLLRRAVELGSSINYVPVTSDDPDKKTYELSGPSIPVDRAEDLHKAIRWLEQLLAVHQRDWPQEAVPTPEQALASHKNGESQALAEAFAEIAGLDPSEWGNRVEEIRTKMPNRGGG